MTTSSPTEQYDAQIAAVTAECERLHEVQRAAHAHCERVREHRIRTRGLALAPDVKAVPDLGALRRPYVEAVHALQDAQMARHDAMQRLDALAKGRDSVERGDTLEHLAAVLALEEVEAQAVDAAIEQLAAGARAFLATAGERANLCRALGVTESWLPDPSGPLVNRVLYQLRLVASSQLTAAVQPTPPLVESHHAMTKATRSVIAQEQPKPAPAEEAGLKS